MKLRIKESSEVREARYGLEPQYDARKSFYGKAHVESDNGVLTLYSYNTPVCRIDGDKVTLLDMWDSSQTTLRHVKEFLQQHGFKVGSKAQIAKLYGENLRTEGVDWNNDLVRSTPDVSGLNKYRVTVFDPSDAYRDSMIKRVYIYAKDEEDARQQMFDSIPNNIKRKYGIDNMSTIEVMKVR